MNLRPMGHRHEYRVDNLFLVLSVTTDRLTVITAGNGLTIEVAKLKRHIVAFDEAT